MSRFQYKPPKQILNNLPASDIRRGRNTKVAGKYLLYCSWCKNNERRTLHKPFRKVPYMVCEYCFKQVEAAGAKELTTFRSPF